MRDDIGNVTMDELAHYGTKGMKWGVRKKSRSEVNEARGATVSRTAAAYTSEKGAGHRWVSAYLTGGLSVGYNYQRSAGYSKGATAATMLVGGPIGNVLAVELASRRATVKD